MKAMLAYGFAFLTAAFLALTFAIIVYAVFGDVDPEKAEVIGGYAGGCGVGALVSVFGLFFVAVIDWDAY